MRGFTYITMLLAASLAPAALACEESPGPNTAAPAPLGKDGKKAAFDKGAKQARVHFKLLDEPLAKIAKACGEDLVVYSGFRSCGENTKPGQAKKSFHLRGMAADLKFCKSKNSLAQMFQILAKAGCGGIGCYPNFIQCDIGPKRQWGPCPGNRPPPDDPPKDDKKDDQQPPSQAYDSQTPSEPTSMAGAPAGGSPPGPVPSSITPSYPPGQAQYPQAVNPQVGRGGNAVPDMRDRTQKPRANVVNGIAPPVEESTVTKNGDRLPGKDGSGGPSNISSDPAAAFAALAGNGSFGQLGAAKLQPGSTGASNAAPGFGGGGINSGGGGGSARGGESAKGGLPANNPYASSRGNGGGGGGGGGSGGGSRSEALASFNNSPIEGKGVGMKGGVVAMDDEIRRIQENDFGGGGDRAPASEGAAASEAESGSLFSRTHAVHERCQRRGWLTRGGG